MAPAGMGSRGAALGGMAPASAEPAHMGSGRVAPAGMVPASRQPGRWPYKPTALWRKAVAVIGLGAFTAICAAALVAVVVLGAVLGALVLEALIG